MASISKGYSFGSTETVTATKLHDLVDLATITGIVNADVDAGANIDSTKLNLSSAGYMTTGGNFTITGTHTYSTAPVFSVSPTFSVVPNLPADTVDAITEIKSTLKSGSDVTLVTGTKGTADYTSKWNSDGDLVDGYEVLDEDDMSSDSETALATQQSIKKYVDDAGALTLISHQEETNVSASTNITVQANKNYVLYYQGKAHATTDTEILLRFNDDSSGYANTATAGTDGADLSAGADQDAGDMFWGVINFSTEETIIAKSVHGTVNGIYENTSNALTNTTNSFSYLGASVLTSVEIVGVSSSFQNIIITLYEISIT